ncbi:MAG: hypothetical protein BGO01_01280 [Armatimonadetes bacterium 55-13]|nr:DUF1232 domain-containing protein [Armatimonadota bacterium]OJU65582.1 MAG: hypothetical protein BGO01_01280 [Armatimonadetes bacterium 55-13]
MVKRSVNRSVNPSRAATPWNAIFSVFMALLYGVSPIDLIPDLIPVLGWLDDAAIVPMFLILAYFQYRKAQRQHEAKARVVVMPPPRN